MRITTAKDLGTALPIGVVQGKELVKEFTLRPYKSRVDRLMNLWREANEGRHVGYEVAKLVALLVENVGKRAYALTEAGDTTPEQDLRVLDWWFGDVMYVYLRIRIQAVGARMSVPYACPHAFQGRPCGHRAEAKADLEEVEVRVIESVAELKAWVKLIDGFSLSDEPKIRVSKLRLQPIPFRAFTLPGGSVEGAEAIGYNQIREAVCEVAGAGPEYILTDADLDEVSKRDQLAINRQAGQVTAGPLLRTTITCPRCSAEIVAALDWSYNNFFDHSVPLSELMT